MDRHFRLLADLNEHELAHANVVAFGHLAPDIQVNSVCRERLNEVSESDVIAGFLCLIDSFELVEDDLEDAVGVVNLADNANRLVYTLVSSPSYDRRTRFYTCQRLLQSLSYLRCS